jgi:hypothetical protein
MRQRGKRGMKGVAALEQRQVHQAASAEVQEKRGG